MKSHIYIQDDQIKDLLLEDISLKKVGILKNGQDIELDIPLDDVYLYVVYDKNFPKTYNTRFLVKEDYGDVELITQPKFNPFKGNPFVIWRSK
ncbi:hypothetical protein CI105_07725 [Candidatus Izimaplasma bacterium ZiA1]|uniref:hypothetical protein n=1 Tax=Candidatus Izimoplasma sp. ZiA1 TaxID=2024899 RepID=UPI000BAA7B02|nr:hypothetical protein CI105_07725 [Candidatus Izimaplasma bacterium ZiA1]